MNWIRASLKYLGIYSSPDKQLLKDDFHYQSEEELPKKTSDTISTIKSFTEKYPINSARDEIKNNTQNTPSLQTESHHPESESADSSELLQSGNVHNETDSNHIQVIEDIGDESILPQDMSTAELVKTEKKKKKGIKKVKKRVSWAVRRSWKWLKRGWSGYAPGVAAGMMYCANAPSTLFNMYTK